MIDIHSHILPLVDDGSSSVDMSLDMLDEAYRDGTKEIVLTPHLAYAYGFENPNYKIKELFGQFKDIVEDKMDPVKRTRNGDLSRVPAYRVFILPKIVIESANNIVMIIRKE